MTEKRRKRLEQKRRQYIYFRNWKLALLFLLSIVMFFIFVIRMARINLISGDKYKKIVLTQQSYNSKTLPYQRGSILDTKGSVLASSVAVYNIILDCTLVLADDKSLDPTVEAVVKCFPEYVQDKQELKDKILSSPKSRYIVLGKKLSYEQIQPFLTLEMESKKDKEAPDINGIWFEKEYKRVYPNDSMASALIGFTSEGNVGTTGLENYYDDVLNGVNGREFGYLNSENDFQRTIIEPQNGKSLVTTIDSNIQSVVEEKVRAFNEAYRNNYRDGVGSAHTGVIVMNPNNGEILAMASYPNVNLNDPRNLSEFYTPEQLEAMSSEDKMKTLNEMWRSFCVNFTFEPGSVQKPFTIATGIDSGKVSRDSTFICDGAESFGSEQVIHCHRTSGHGEETVELALTNSCNDALMQMSYLIGKEDFLKYQQSFGFGLKTNIDLPGEINTSKLVFTVDQMKRINLATCSFGQSFNCTMIQMISAYSSLINGGILYQPHIVRKITDEDGNTISAVEPKALRETISESTSATIRQYMQKVITEGTGRMAKVDGYSMGGKTGTAEKLVRGNGKYVIDFIGFAPGENPKVAIYTVVDEPNVENQSSGAHAMNITREILREVLPYLNVYKDEAETGANVQYGITGYDQPANAPQGEIPPVPVWVEEGSNPDVTAPVEDNPEGNP